MTKAQTPAQEPETEPEAQTPPETPEGPENGTSEPTAPPEAETEPQSTKAQTFQDAAKAVQEQEYVLPTQVTSTDKLEAEGKSKGLTFAEQAAEARELYGSGNPSDTTED